jgi:hypothetical protein
MPVLMELMSEIFDKLSALIRIIDDKNTTEKPAMTLGFNMNAK